MKKLAPFQKEKFIREKVLAYLRNNPNGKSTTEIAKATNISRKTLEKHLQLLVFENEIYVKQFGPTRVYYPNHRLHYLDFIKLNVGNRTYWFDVMKNEYGSYLVIQEKRKINEEYETKGSILIPINKINLFINALQKISKSKRIIRNI